MRRKSHAAGFMRSGTLTQPAPRERRRAYSRTEAATPLRRAHDTRDLRSHHRECSPRGGGKRGLDFEPNCSQFGCGDSIDSVTEQSCGLGSTPTRFRYGMSRKCSILHELAIVISAENKPACETIFTPMYV